MHKPGYAANPFPLAAAARYTPSRFTGPTPTELMQSAHSLTFRLAQSDCSGESGFNIPVEVSPCANHNHPTAGERDKNCWIAGMSNASPHGNFKVSNVSPNR